MDRIRELVKKLRRALRRQRDTDPGFAPLRHVRVVSTVPYDWDKDRY